MFLEVYEMPDKNRQFMITYYMPDVLKTYSFSHHIFSKAHRVPDTVLGSSIPVGELCLTLPAGYHQSHFTDEENQSSKRRQLPQVTALDKGGFKILTWVCLT